MRYMKMIFATLLIAMVACTSHTLINNDPRLNQNIGKKIVLLKDFYSFEIPRNDQANGIHDDLALIDSTANIYYAFKTHGPQNIGKCIDGEKISGYFPAGTTFTIVGFQRSYIFEIGELLECIVIERNGNANRRYTSSQFVKNHWPPDDYNNLFREYFVQLIDNDNTGSGGGGVKPEWR
ncbi:MAG: hypothetical protein NTX50_02625 [Candidatus Sumerlaeota bacterium]|nr:hypothetical protein [Candidatus Sumerlaeota bacterium]